MAAGVPKTSEKAGHLDPGQGCSQAGAKQGLPPAKSQDWVSPFQDHAPPTSCRHLVAPWWQGTSLLLPQTLVRDWGPGAAGNLQGGSNG